MNRHLLTILPNGIVVSTVRLPGGDYECLVFPESGVWREIAGMTHLSRQEAEACHHEMVERYRV